MSRITKNYYDHSQSNDIEVNTPMTIDQILELREQAIRKRMAEDAVVVEYEPADSNLASPPPENPRYPFVTNPALADAVVAKLLAYMEGKSPTKPKDIMKPIRAAQDAGVIRHITFAEMKAAFPKYCPKQKSSVAKYTKEDDTPYYDQAFKAMVEDFRRMKG